MKQGDPACRVLWGLVRGKDRIFMGEGSEDLLGGGATAAGAAREEGAGGALLGDCRVPVAHAVVGQNVRDRPVEDVAQDLGRVVAEADFPAVIDCHGATGEVGRAGREADMGEGCGVEKAEGCADAADEGHVRVRGGEVVDSTESGCQLVSGGRQFAGVGDAHSPDVEAVDHDRTDTAVADEGEGRRDPGEIGPGHDKDRRSSDARAHPPQRTHRRLPRPLPARQVVVDVGLRAEQRNLDRAHPQPKEVLQPVGGQQPTVGQDVDLRATVAGVEDEVMDVRQEKGLAAGEGDGPDPRLGKELAEGFTGLARVGRGDSRAFFTPMIITEPATLVAGSGKFIDYVLYAERGHQIIVTLYKPRT